MLVLVAALGLSACGGGSGSATTNRAGSTTPGPDVTLTATTHQPKVGAPWPIVLRAHSADGTPLQGEVRYQFLFGGSVVARRSHHRFKGVFHDTLTWPANSLGLPLTFRAVVTTPEGTRKLDYAVRVRR